MALQLIRGLINLPQPFPGCVMTMGNFDGIHLGHQQIIAAVLQKAKQLNLPSLIITFEPQPNEFFSRGKAPARLTRLREKIMRFEQLGVEYVLCLRFDEALAKIEAKNFVTEILINQLKIAHIVIGDDFHFGAERMGDRKLLEAMGKQYGFTVQQMATFNFNAQRVSSTQIRLALKQGNLSKTEQLLGRSFGMGGRVVHGDKRGRTIGFPTANVFLCHQSIPIQGIYAVKTYGLDSKPILGVASVGNRPTVNGSHNLLEVYLFNFDRQIYGEHIYIEFVHKLRDEERFESFELLRQQIVKDVEEAKRFFSNYSG